MDYTISPEFDSFNPEEEPKVPTVVYKNLDGQTVGRFQLISGPPPMLPGRCQTCGSGSPDRKYVDFGFTLQRYGKLYICDQCFYGAAIEMFALVPTVQLIDAQARSAVLAEDNLRLIEEKMELQNALAGVDSLRKLLNDIDSGSVDSTPSVEESKSTAASSNPEPPKREARSTKSAPKRGSRGVPQHDSIDDIISEL